MNARQQFRRALAGCGYDLARAHWTPPRLILQERCDPRDWDDYVSDHGDAAVDCLFVGGWEIDAVIVGTPLNEWREPLNDAYVERIEAPYSELVLDAIGGLR